MVSDNRMSTDHFFFSNKFIQLILGLRPDHSRRDQFLLLCAMTFYPFPLLIHQFYQLFTSEVTLQSAVRVLQKTMGAINFLLVYSNTCFSFVTMKLIQSELINSYKQVSNEIDLFFFEEHIKQSKLYLYVLCGVLSIYSFSVLFPCIVKVCLYFLGILDDNKLILLLPVNNVNKSEVKYFCLLFYQIIAFIIVMTVGAVSLSAYLIVVLFACYQFRVLIFKIQRPFERNLKYIEVDCYFRTPQEEWDWIVDVINSLKIATGRCFKGFQIGNSNQIGNFVFVEIFLIIIIFLFSSRFVNLLSNLSKEVYLLIVVLSMTLIISDFVYIFQLSISLKNAVEIIECSFYIIGSIMTLYINFYLGQELMNYSDMVFKELCQVPFYILSNKSQKILLLLITRSFKPSMLSIGGMFVCSHEMFADFMRKAFSFAMVYYSYV